MHVYIYLRTASLSFEHQISSEYVQCVCFEMSNNIKVMTNVFFFFLIIKVMTNVAMWFRAPFWNFEYPKKNSPINWDDIIQLLDSKYSREVKPVTAQDPTAIFAGTGLRVWKIALPEVVVRGADRSRHQMYTILGLN